MTNINATKGFGRDFGSFVSMKVILQNSETNLPLEKRYQECMISTFSHNLVWKTAKCTKTNQVIQSP